MKQNSEELYDLIRTGRENDPEQVEQFIENFDASVCNFISEFHESLLQKAISCDKYDIAKFLIEKKCNLDNKDDENNVALGYLLNGYNNTNESFYHELVGLMIDNDADVNIGDEHGNTPLMDAVSNAKVPLDIIEKLLKKGANPHYKNNAGVSPYDLVKEYDIKDLNEILESYI